MIGAALVAIRHKLGFKSARSFYHEHLLRRSPLEFNYSYYMKIEGDRIVPSPSVLSTICATLDRADREELTLIYCQAIFPKEEALFARCRSAAQDLKRARSAAQKIPSELVSKQKILTAAQIATISKSQEHYALFLTVTLARKPVTRVELNQRLAIKNIDAVLMDLQQAKLILFTEGYIISISNEMKFPPATTPQQKKVYDQIDLWNGEFKKSVSLAPQLDKMLLRRVSPRYLSMIEAHCQVLLDLVRASDEIDSDYNDVVLMLNLTLHQGSLPG